MSFGSEISIFILFQLITHRWFATFIIILCETQLTTLNANDKDSFIDVGNTNE